MVDFLLLIAQETWYVVKEASVFLLLGFIIAGVLGVLVPTKAMVRFFGRGKVKSVLWASALGVPLPLCSCGVLPAALGLRREGATKGATVSFLISTPETGVDSISLSYALMDPVITVFRPVAAVITAFTAGIATNFWGEKKRKGGKPETGVGEPSSDVSLSEVEEHVHGHAHHGHGIGPTESDLRTGRGASYHAAKRVLNYAFRDLLDETSYWLVLGIIISGIVAAFLPPTVIERYLSGEFTSMLAMLLIGIPIYTCASASTPIAAALVLKGLNPGAALVFLLAGPATNLGSLTVLLKFLGGRIVVIYLITIALVALLAGYSLNWIYQGWNLDPEVTFGSGTGFIPEWSKTGGALVLVGLLIASMRRTHVPGEWLWLRDRLAALTGLFLNAARLRLGAAAAVTGIYVFSGFFTVQPGEVAIKLRFGEIVAPDLSSGLHYRFPWPFESHRLIEGDRVQRLELGFRSEAKTDTTQRYMARKRLTVGGPSNPVPTAIASTGFWFQKEKVATESFLLTGDGNLLDINLTVQYRVKDPVAYTFRTAEPEALVRSITMAALRGIVGTQHIDAIYTTARGDIEQQVASTVQNLLDSYEAGIEIASIRLLYVHPPKEVHSSFRDVASAQEDKLHIVNRAMTFAVEGVNLAKGDAAARIEEALAFKEEKTLRARGDGEAFNSRAREYERAPDLTRFRLHLETIEEALPQVQTFVRPGADDVKDFDLWLLEPFAPRKGQ